MSIFTQILKPSNNEKNYLISCNAICNPIYFTNYKDRGD